MKPRQSRIPSTLTEKDFNEFVFPMLTTGSRGPKSKITNHKIFNYILYLMHTGCQWHMLPIDKTESGHPEISYTRLFRHFKCVLPVSLRKINFIYFHFGVDRVFAYFL